MVNVTHNKFYGVHMDKNDVIRKSITEIAFVITTKHWRETDYRNRIYWSLRNEYEVNYTIPRNLKWNDEVCRVKHIHKLTKW